MDEKYKYTIVDGIDKIIDEKGNTFLALRKMYWGDREESAKLEIRKYINTSDGDERPNHGVSFLTKDGPSSLVHELLGLGYGDTQRVLENIKDRPDFNDSLNSLNIKITESSNTYKNKEDILDY